MLRANITVRTIDGAVEVIGSPIDDGADVKEVTKGLDKFHAILAREIKTAGGVLVVVDDSGARPKKRTFVAKHITCLTTEVTDDDSPF